MPDDLLFDKPVEAFLADNNLLKWLSAADPGMAGLESVAQAPSLENRQELMAAVKHAIASWDPNRGPEHEETWRSDLEATLNKISAQALGRLTESQRELVRAQQKKDMGYAYLFVAPPDELSLTKQQQAELSELSQRATEEATSAARQEMDRVQIRNPQAYVAYKISKLYEQIRKHRSMRGRQFYDQSLDSQQRDRLKLD